MSEKTSSQRKVQLRFTVEEISAIHNALDILRNHDHLTEPEASAYAKTANALNLNE